MRYVTNNQATKPDAEEVRRGRGRPRKPDAMTNAERQAIYRQRKRAALINVTVSKNSNRADEMQILHDELTAARDALVQLRLAQEAALASAESHKRQASVLRKQLARAEAELIAISRWAFSNVSDRPSPAVEASAT